MLLPVPPGRWLPDRARDRGRDGARLVPAGHRPRAVCSSCPGNCWFAVGPGGARRRRVASPRCRPPWVLAGAGRGAVRRRLRRQRVPRAPAAPHRLRELADRGPLGLRRRPRAVPVGLGIAIADGPRPVASRSCSRSFGLLSVFARERRGRLEQLVELNDAYRGTALVLGDVVEADDELHGRAHPGRRRSSRSRSRETLGLEPGRAAQPRVRRAAARRRQGRHPEGDHQQAGQARRRDEWADHQDPHGRGPADARPRRRVHARASASSSAPSHERWDGGGYPDGLAGEAIPLEARIIACCDACNAMTTTRSYRKAMTREAARRRDDRCAGTQFDPAVVDAVLRVSSAADLRA